MKRSTTLAAVLAAVLLTMVVAPVLAGEDTVKTQLSGL